MTLWTVLEYFTKVKNDLDLNEETFITDDEMMGYLNEAVNRVEQLMLGINEDYFLTSADIALTEDSNYATLPTGIYAHKIRKIFYDDGAGTKYEIKRIRDLSSIPHIEDDEDYRYIIDNSLASGARLRIFPASRETSSTNVTCWHLRNARTVTATTDEVDCPEAQNYIISYLRAKCLEKEGHPMLEKAVLDLSTEEGQLITTLNAMVQDEDNQILLDQSWVEDCGY